MNGRVRGRICVPTKASKETIERVALADENVQRHVADKEVKKIIVVPAKLVNIVIGA